ncbi:MAG TPA: SNF2-related protein [Candidatus Xenobia bacterium]
MSWQPQQRVVNEAEPDLGIGNIVRIVDHRTVEVAFEASGVTRLYNIRTAPLRRLVLAKGQQAVGRQGTRFKITGVRDEGGLLVYLGEANQVLHERDLAAQMAAAHAVDQLLAGQLAPPGDYGLRRDGWALRSQTLGSEVRGVSGARVRLLAHQLYIADMIARRERPRVLLADEVGLGKTIEAGLIFCALRAVGRANRVLVLTPRNLVHQWLAEMYRRFNAMFTVLDEGRCEALEQEGLSAFQTTPLALCSLELVAKHKERLMQAAAAGWDLLIVDEAHHLGWQKEGAGRRYKAVERLAARSRGLLLLTATPQRRGYETEFGLLRLVDPDRFSDYEAFQQELTQLRPVTAVARHLAEGQIDTEQVSNALRQAWPEDKALQGMVAGDREALLSALIDRHGTGRVLVRNRRARLHGFPKRVLQSVSLELGERLGWLVEFLRQEASAKVLLIAKETSTVIDLQEGLREHTAMPTAIFHDGLSLIERDRQAAWFADPDGARVLLSNEIGGEGRNFQFAHHLVLWDLPVDPDILEQRIGRLDRIGQEHDVHVHALWQPDQASEVVFAWHERGLDSFTQPLTGAEQVMMALGGRVDTVMEAFRAGAADRQEQLLALLEETRQTRMRVEQDIQENVDTLVDLNSFDVERGEALVAAVQDVDADDALASYMSRVLERFGVNEDILDRRGRRVIKPGDLMFVEVFPGLPPDGLGATYERQVALEREDLAFLTRDHPLVEGALGLILDESHGRASVCIDSQARDQGLLIQFLFVLEATGPESLELSRYLPPTPIEVALDGGGMPARAWAQEVVSREARLAAVGHQGFARYAGWLHEQFPPLVASAEKQIADAVEQRRLLALGRAREVLSAEQERLESLHRINPTVSEKEVQAHRRRMLRVLECLSKAEPRLDALRLVAMHKAT